MIQLGSSTIETCRPGSRLTAALQRLQRLEALAADSGYVARLAASGRTIRLAAAIAWASDIVNQLSKMGPRESGLAQRVLH